jgi:hypothetical protein
MSRSFVSNSVRVHGLSESITSLWKGHVGTYNHHAFISRQKKKKKEKTVDTTKLMMVGTSSHAYCYDQLDNSHADRSTASPPC